MKKLLSLVLILLLLVSLALPVAAVRDTSFEARLAAELKQLGLFQGVSDTDFELDREPTRPEALAMLVRALGKEAEAKAAGLKHPFTDVPIWCNDIVAYAYANKLTNGQTETEFGVGAVTAAMYLTFMLRALGYTSGNNAAEDADFVWYSPFALAQQVGILPARTELTHFWRADAVTVTYAALNAEMKDGSGTLAQKLIAAGVFSAEVFERVYRPDVFETEVSGDPAPAALQLENGAMRVAVGDAIAADLDGDGTAETVRLWLDRTDYGYNVHLSIDGKEYTDAMYADVGYFDCPDNSWWAITDLDGADGLLEIAVQDWGPSDDLTTGFFRFTGGKLRWLGSVEGFLFYDSGSGSVTLAGDGTVRSEMRLSVLQTWWTTAQYAIAPNGRFAPVAQDFYAANNPDQQITLLCPLYAWDAPDGARQTLPAGTEALLVGTDNVRWIKLQLADGSAHWLHLTEDGGYALEGPDGAVYSWEALDGLLMAD